MSAAIALFILLLPVTAAAFFIAAVLRLRPWNGVVIGAAVVTGAGAASCGYALRLHAPYVEDSVYALVDGTAWASLMIPGCVAWMRRRPSCLPAPTRRGTEASGSALFGRFIFVTVVAWAASVFVTELFRVPHGGHDAWAVWNLHTRFLHRGGANWTDMFHPALAWSHPDYPLLLPGFTARIQAFAGERCDAAGLTAAAFLIGALALLHGGLAALKGRRIALLGLAFVACNTDYVLLAAHRQADVPFSSCILGACVLFALYEKRNAPAYALVGAACAGCAAWTKNEGLLFLALPVSAWAVLRMRRFPEDRRRLPALLLFGAAPFVVARILFASAHGAENDIVAGLDIVGVINRLADPSRYAQISAVFGWKLLRMGAGSAVLLVVCAALLAWRCGKRRWTTPRLFVLPGLQLAGYLALFVVTPRDLSFHLHAMLRLLLHLWPAVVFAILFICPTEDVACGCESPKTDSP